MKIPEPPPEFWLAAVILALVIAAGWRPPQGPDLSRVHEQTQRNLERAATLERH